jgi:hypothetical protein
MGLRVPLAAYKRHRGWRMVHQQEEIKLKTLIAILCLLTLVGCGESSKIKEAVRDKLKDPGSANFKEVLVSSDGKRACVAWNAKNPMGGYGGWEVALLENRASSWNVTDMTRQERNCSELGFKILDAKLIAENDARKMAVEMLSKARNISITNAAFAAKHECESIVMKYTILAAMEASDKLEGVATTTWSLDRQKLMEERLSRGSCDTGGL